MKKEWRPVVGYEELYQVSNRGRVWSNGRTLKCKSAWGKWTMRTKRSKFLKPTSTYYKGGDRLLTTSVKLYDLNGKKRSVGVHTLVLEAFVGPCPEGMECCHEDGNPENNRVENLRWDTKQSNMDDREKHGKHVKGSDSVKAKLTEEDIPTIRERLKDTTWGIMSAIARDYKVDTATIRDIRDNRTWKHVPN